MIDILIILFLAFGFFVGLKIGFVKTISLPLGIVLGLVLGARLSPGVSFYFGKAPVAKIIIFVLIFLLVLILVINLGRILSKIFHTILLGFFDSLLGGIVGLILSFIICGFLLFLSYRFLPRSRSYIEGSGLARRVLQFFPVIPFRQPKEIESKKPVAEISLFLPFFLGEDVLTESD